MTTNSKELPGWIPLVDAIEMIANRIHPQGDPTGTERAVREKIRYAEKQGKFKRKYIANKIHLPMQRFQYWAIDAWPTLNLRDVFKLPELTLVNLTDYKMVLFPSSLDRTSINIPENYDELKELHLCVLQDLLTAKLDLSSCQAELNEFRDRADALRRKLSKAGKQGGRGRTK